VVSGVQWPRDQSAAAGTGFGVVVVSQEWKLQLGCREAAAEGGDRTEEPAALGNWSSAPLRLVFSHTHGTFIFII
jgi:hypothetical protein